MGTPADNSLGILGNAHAAQRAILSGHMKEAAQAVRGMIDSTATRSFKNNNPGNIKFGDFAKSHGATGHDSQGFAIFPNEGAGSAAQRSLWDSPAYANKPLSEALSKWSGRGYGPEKFGLPGEATWGGLSAGQKTKLLADQRAAEGWHGPGQTPSANLGLGTGAGQFNFMKGQFGAHGTNIGTYITNAGRTIRLNNATAPHMLGFLNEMESMGMPFGGKGTTSAKTGGYDSFNDRPIRGGSSWSQHAYGNAVDLEALGFTSTKEFTGWQKSHGDAIRAAAEHWGMKWGGDMRRKDTPHYEWGGIEGTHRQGLDADARKHIAPNVVKHEGHAKVSVDFRGMPRGVKVAGKSEGIFKEVRLNRGRAAPIAEG